MSAQFRLQKLHPPLLKPATFALNKQQILTLHGASGSGKTLFLRAIIDLDINSGEAWLNDTPRSAMSAPQWRTRVGYLPAESYWWHDYVGEHAKNWDQQQLAMLGFEPDVLNWEVARLSSGERQRLGLIRLLGNQPEVLLLDEPTANLDADNTAHVEQLVLQYLRTQQACAIWVSHTSSQRQQLADIQANIIAGKITLQADQ